MTTAENKKEPTVIEAYQAARNDIANLMGFLTSELTKDDKKIRWGKDHGKVTWCQIANLTKVRSDLIDTLAFLSNSEPEQIKEAMEDARENAKI